MKSGPSVCVIVPAYNAEATIELCLQAINAAIRPGDELILYDDGATDSTNAIAVAAGARILRNDGDPKGPAHGRNAAAGVTNADLLLFVDADVVIASNVIDILAADILSSGAIAAFGSYDDTPRSLRSTSLYANLRHHYVHQNGPVEASTFWSGIGMIDRKVFLEAGGYDAALFKFPSIEDVELGVRLISAGYRIRLVRSAQGKHCKDWSLWRVWHTDVVRRAIPWSGLIADGQTAGVDLNLASREKVTTLFALAGPLFILGSLWNLWLLSATFLAIGIYVYRNRGFFDVLRKRMGVPDFLAGIAMHWIYHIYASAAFVSVYVLTKIGLRHAPRYLSFNSAPIRDYP